MGARAGDQTVIPCGCGAAGCRHRVPAEPFPRIAVQPVPAPGHPPTHPNILLILPVRGRGTPEPLLQQHSPRAGAKSSPHLHGTAPGFPWAAVAGPPRVSGRAFCTGFSARSAAGLRLPESINKDLFRIAALLGSRI